MISGPPRKKKDIAQEVFESAKKWGVDVAALHACLEFFPPDRHGAVPVEEESRERREPVHSFTGSGQDACMYVCMQMYARHWSW